MSDLDRLTSWLTLHFARVNAKQLSDVEAVFGSLEQAVSAPESAWRSAQVLKEKQLDLLFDPGLAEKVTQALEWAEQPNQHLLTLASDDYPPLLKQIADPPPVLYVRGQVALLSDPQLAIVGSRNASKQGRLTAEDFAQYLAGVGLTITSGLASGIDKAAHEGALKAQTKAGGPQGTTISVVATGLDRVYPAANRELAHRIADTGAMVSEYPLGTQPLAHFFPQRNRIISGLSLGTLVVEAALKSGSLITARTALEQGREVFAVPGSINNPQVKGCHQLIRQGAKLVESGQDILEELSPQLQPSLFPDEASSPEAEAPSSQQGILKYIEFEPIGLDELAVLSKLPVSDIQSQLLMLELSGDIEALSAGRWRRLR
ncbi:DNA processing protein DprA [Thiomicrospira sp. XS5]|uniref:DNA-processing protein DprA n=1 Tax=Thiomicrospira sp. XS5 TaxID=1775636 RepID=UPI00074A4619|nr:DNA-processing protein DprA [Thiomicrospira sp. XS5]KUJ74371.1 DNA processing protein DprA [Thiomicrospira sp. XS5]